MSTESTEESAQFVENFVIITTRIMIKDLVTVTLIFGTSEQVPSLLLSDIPCSPGQDGSKV